MSRMCLGVAKCVHHIDPAVQWLERDYEFMYEQIEAPMFGLDDTANSTVLMDSRTHDEFFYTVPSDLIDESERGHSTECPQPMFTLKLDHYGDEDALAMMPCRWRWDASEGPVLPFEEGSTPAQADEYRSENWQVYYLGYFTSHSIEPPPALVAAVEEIRVQQLAESEARRAEAKAEAERRRAQAHLYGQESPRGVRADMAILDEVFNELRDPNEPTMGQVDAYRQAMFAHPGRSPLNVEETPALLSRGFFIPNPGDMAQVELNVSDEMSGLLESMGIQLDDWQRRFFINAVESSTTSEDQEDK